MKRLPLVSTILLTALICTGCGNETKKVIKAQEGFADKACACNTIACVKKVQEEQNAWVAAYGHTVTGNDETVAKLEAANKRLSECILKVVEEVQGQ